MTEFLKTIENKKLKEIEEKIGEDILYDGIVNEELWEGKIKFVLKEVNDKEYFKREEKYTLPQLLKSPFNKEFQTVYNTTKEQLEKDLKPTWYNIALWAQGIHSIFDKSINSVFDRGWYKIMDYPDWLKELQTVSIINIKKTPGGSESDYNELRKAITDYGYLTWEQIKLGSPNFVIFCGTGDFFSLDKIWEKEPPIKKWKLTNKGFEYYKDMNKTVFIKYWHPNAYFPNNMMYYALMDIVSELSEKYNV